MFFFLDTILPEPPSAHANVGETFSVMLWHRGVLGHINARSLEKLTQEKGTGMVKSYNHSCNLLFRQFLRALSVDMA